MVGQVSIGVFSQRGLAHDATLGGRVKPVVGPRRCGPVLVLPCTCICILSIVFEESIIQLGATIISGL